MKKHHLIITFSFWCINMIVGLYPDLVSKMSDNLGVIWNTFIMLCMQIKLNFKRTENCTHFTNCWMFVSTWSMVVRPREMAAMQMIIMTNTSCLQYTEFTLNIMTLRIMLSMIYSICTYCETGQGSGYNRGEWSPWKVHSSGKCRLTSKF